MFMVCKAPFDSDPELALTAIQSSNLSDESYQRLVENWRSQQDAINE